MREGAEAECAYQAWRQAPGVDAYAVYLAADERAAAAQDELAAWMNARNASVDVNSRTTSSLVA